jgi:hypothetical protein
MLTPPLQRRTSAPKNLPDDALPAAADIVMVTVVPFTKPVSGPGLGTLVCGGATTDATVVNPGG